MEYGRRYIFLIIFLFFSVYSFSNDNVKLFYFGKEDNVKPNLEIGFELSELLQNSFSNIGLNNFTFLVGQRLTFLNLGHIGYRFMIMNVELSSSHLADSNSVIGLYGNRNDLSGKYTGIRLYFDWYPLLLRLDFFRIRPIISFGFGYDNSVINNPRYTLNYYDRSQMPLALSLRLKYSFWDIFFIETPFMELSFNIWRNIPSSMTLGDLIIDRPDLINIYAWITFGFNIFFKN